MNDPVYIFIILLAAYLVVKYGLFLIGVINYLIVYSIKKLWKTIFQN